MTVLKNLFITDVYIDNYLIVASHVAVIMNYIIP